MNIILKIEISNEDGMLHAVMKGSGFCFGLVENNIEEILKEAKDSLRDYLENEGKDNPDWAGVLLEDVKFEIEDITPC
jgi:predicted HicB family RNase H-like nuclease